eukprot:985195-Alexandrium_andersonii.AAC.1
MQGWRRHHEDIFLLKAHIEGAPGVGVFAVLDGHGGSQVVRAAAGQLEENLSDMAKAVKFGAIPEAAFRGVFASIDA